MSKHKDLNTDVIALLIAAVGGVVLASAAVVALVHLHL